MKSARGRAARHRLPTPERRVRPPPGTLGKLRIAISNLRSEICNPQRTSSWSCLESSPRSQRGDRGFKSRRGCCEMAWYANRESGQVESLVMLSVGSTPTHATAARIEDRGSRIEGRRQRRRTGDRMSILDPRSSTDVCVGCVLVSLSGCNPSAFGLCRFNSCPTRFKSQPTWRQGLRHGCCVRMGNVPIQTSKTGRLSE